MELDKEQYEVVHRALTEWEQAGKLQPDKAAELRADLSIRRNDRQQLAQYFFFIALSCTLLAFAAIFLSEKLLERIKAYFAWSDFAVAGITAVLSILWFWYIGRRRSGTKSSAYEIYMALGGLSVLTCLVYVCKAIHADATYYTTFLFLATLSLLSLGAVMRSPVLWLGGLLAVTGWFGAATAAYENNYLFFGMNYAVRYVLFGIVLLAASLGLRSSGKLLFSRQITYVIALSVFFVALWAVTVFGNFSSLERWQRAHQSQIIVYSVFMAAASGLALYLGIRYRDSTARDFGVIFLLVNLYTRYFEYFWDTMNKGLFFLVLAITFGLLGRWLERKNKAAKATPQ